MLKKKITVLLLAFALSSGAFAQDNAVLVGFGGGFNFPFMFYSDIHCSYECMLTSNMSLRVNAASELYPMAIIIAIINDEPNIFGSTADLQVLWYPQEGPFYAGIGLGYSHYLSRRHSIVATPEIGWKFDPGNEGGFILNIGIRSEVFVPLGKYVFTDSAEGSDLIPFNVGLRFGLGWAF